MQMPTRQELVLQFMQFLAPSYHYGPNKEDVDKIYEMACLLADKYLESI